MIIGLGFLLIGGFALYYAITGADPIDALRRALTGMPPPEPLAGPTTLGPGDRSPGGRQGQAPSDVRSSGGTRQLQPGLGIALAVPGSHLIRICGAGSVPESEHPHCNAADVGGSRAVLFAIQSALLVFAMAGGPIHCIIGPSNVRGWDKGAIRSRDSGWKPSRYDGPNSHQGHVHFSAWPSVGGGC